MQLTVILAILAAMLCADAVPAEPASDVARRLVLAALACAVVVVLARVIAGVTVLTLRGDESHRRWARSRYEKLRRAHTLVWLIASGGILYGLAWPQVVRQNWSLSGAVLVDELLILAPVVGPLFLSWWAFGEVERTLGRESVESLAARELHFTPTLSAATAAAVYREPTAPRGPAGRASGGAGAWWHARHELGPVLVPLCLVIGIQDIAALSPVVASSRFAWLAPAVPLAALVIGFPWLLRHIWQTEPLVDGPLRARLRDVEQRLGISTREILVWRTGGTVVNAAVAGFVPWLRYVFLSDALLARMNVHEVAAVYAHELGHVRHRHMTLRLLSVVLPVVIWRAAVASLPVGVETASLRLASFGLSPTMQPGVVLLLLVTWYALVVFAWYCRILEQEADLCGCRGCDPRGELTPEGAEQFVAALAVLPGGLAHPARRGWLHPSLAERAGFVRRIANSPVEHARFLRFTRRLARWLVGLVAAFAGWSLVVAVLSAA